MCFKDIVDSRSVVYILPHDQEAWSGPINWNPHHDVLKESVTTLFRLVSNSPFKLEQFLIPKSGANNAKKSPVK